MNEPSFLLRTLPFGMRLGISCLIGVLAMGIAASVAHVHEHYESRDERPGLTLDDFEGAYRGLDRPARLLTTIEAGHPEGLDAETKKIFGDWLRSDRVVESYDDLDLGDFAPAELIAVHCLDCHSRQSTGENAVGDRIPLDYFDDVETLAFSQRVEPTPVAVLTASTHAHALALASLTLVIAALAWCTSWPRRWVSLSIATISCGLFFDIGGWWLAREVAAGVGVVAVAGFVYNFGTGLVLVAILLDLWLPRKKAAVSASE